MIRVVMFFSLATVASCCLADYSEDCKAAVAKDVEDAARRKLSMRQQDEITDAGAKLCLQKTLTEIHKESLSAKDEFIDKNIKLNASYCGASPELIGRAKQCSRANSEVLSVTRQRDESAAELDAENKRIKRLSKEYEKILAAKPMLDRKADPVADRKRNAGAAIARVKRDILESMKDPDSAKFRRITTSSDGSLVCGEVNAKNAMGGYVGFRKFANIEDKGADFFFYEEAGNSRITDLCEKQAGL